MFSNRLKSDLSPNALSIRVHEKRSKGETIFDLTESNPTRVGLAYDAEKILAAISRPEAMTYTPDPRGSVHAREAIAGYYRKQGDAVDPEALFLTASTSEAYSILFKLLGNPGDEVLIPQPGYPLLCHLAYFENLQPFSYPMRYDDTQGWGIDLEILEALITPKSRAIVVVNPNNPTGNYLKQGELAALDGICRRNRLALIVDEVFSDFESDPSPERVRTAANRSETLTFVLNGFSKMLALPQVKLGWIAVSGDPDRVREARLRLEILLDFYLSVATPVQHAAGRLLGLRGNIQGQILRRIAANSRFLEEQVLGASNCRVLIREGGWYAVIEIRDMVSDEDRVLRLAQDHNTLVHPGYFYGFCKEGYGVVSLLPPVETFRTGISRLISCFGRRQA